MLAGQSTSADSSTGIEIGGETGSADPALMLSNANGPSLFLEPLAADYTGELELGQIANTVLGPVLVARGYSNKEVAAELYLTPKTVEFHLRRIYAKLGVRTRGELRHLRPGH